MTSDNNGSNGSNSVVVNDLLQALDDEELVDVRLIASDGETVPANRFILAARSRVWKKMLYGSFREASTNDIQLPSYDSRLLKAIVYFCSTNSIEPYIESLRQESKYCPDVWDESTVRQMVKLLKAADYFELADLQAQASCVVQEVIAEYPPLACIVYDEASDDSKLYQYALQIIECRPYVALDTAPTTTSMSVVTSSNVKANDDSEQHHDRIRVENSTDSTSKHVGLGGGIECLRAEQLIALVKNEKLELGELFLFQMLCRWLEANEESHATLETMQQCMRHVHFENIEPQILLSEQVQGRSFVSEESIVQAVTKQALRASQDRIWSLRCRGGRESSERVLVEGAGCRDANGMYYRIAGLANGDLYSKREVPCGQQNVYTLSCSFNQDTNQYECRLFCSKVLTHKAVTTLSHNAAAMQISSPSSVFGRGFFQPVLQVVVLQQQSSPLSIARQPFMAQHGPTSSPGIAMYYLEVSDGDNTMPGFLADNLASLAEKGDIVKNSVMKVLEFDLCEYAPARTAIIIRKVNIVSSTPGHRFGNPNAKASSSSLSRTPTPDQTSASSVANSPIMVESETPTSHAAAMSTPTATTSTTTSNAQRGDGRQNHQNLYSCIYAVDDQARDTKIPRTGWKADEQGLLPNPVCTWIPAISKDGKIIKFINNNSSSGGSHNNSFASSTTTSLRNRSNHNPPSPTNSFNGTVSVISTGTTNSRLAL